MVPIITHPTQKLITLVCDLPEFGVVGNAMWLNACSTSLFLSATNYSFSYEVQESILGITEITSDVLSPASANIGNLDEHGVVKVGTTVGKEDVLIGAVKPKERSELSPEEKLLHAIFGRCIEDVEDDSVYYPFVDPGVVVSACCTPHWHEEKVRRMLNARVVVNTTYSLEIGDVLRDDKGNTGVVSAIADEAIILPKQRQLHVVIHPQSSMVAQLQNVQTLYFWSYPRNKYITSATQSRRKIDRDFLYRLFAAGNEKTGKNVNYIARMIGKKRCPGNLQDLVFLGKFQLGELELHKESYAYEHKVEDSEKQMPNISALLDYEAIAKQLLREESLVEEFNGEDDEYAEYDDDYEYDSDGKSFVGQNPYEDDKGDEEYDDYEEYYK